MISTPLRPRLLTHTRSSSLPSRSHPLVPQFNDHLHRLNADQSTPCSLSSISKQLHHLEDLFTCVDDLLHLPHTHHVFGRESHESWVVETLDGYLSLVDACSTAKDFMFNAEGCLLDLLSFLRRRRDIDHLCSFVATRKADKRMIQKYLRSIWTMKNRPASVSALDKDQETIAIISMLREAEAVTLDLIESLLFTIGGMRIHSSGWSFVSRLVHAKKFSSRDHRDALEFEGLDAVLCKLVSMRASKSCDVSMLIDDLQQQLREMYSNVQNVEEVLERLFKRLVKTRVSLLNLQSQQ